MLIVASLLLLATEIHTPDSSDKPNIFPVIISYAAPPTFEVCKSIDPAKADNYAIEMSHWLQRNGASVEKLKALLAAKVGEGGTSQLDQLRDDMHAAVEDFKRFPVETQKAGCGRMYSYVGSN